MRLLATPAWLAGVAVLLGAAAHPLAALERWPAARAVVPALALLFVLSLLARALSGRLPDRVLALGAVIALGGLATDALRGHTGSLTLATGQGTRSFEEEGPGGRRLGLRPLGFALSVERAEVSGDAVLNALADDGAELRISVGPGRSARVGALQFGDPTAVPTGEARSLALAVSVPSGAQQVLLTPGQAARVGDVEIGLEQYFADFALDATRKPFSRSKESRNPAALLNVRKGGQAFRLFVIRSLPGIHQVPGLNVSIALVAVDPQRVLRLRVTESKAGAVVAAGLVVAALGLALALKEQV